MNFSLASFACCYIYWLKFVTSMLSSFEMTYLPSIRVNTLAIYLEILILDRAQFSWGASSWVVGQNWVYENSNVEQPEDDIDFSLTLRCLPRGLSSTWWARYGLFWAWWPGRPVRTYYIPFKIFWLLSESKPKYSFGHWSKMTLKSSLDLLPKFSTVPFITLSI